MKVTKEMERNFKEKAKEEIIYPDSDGQPMAENTLQFDWIVKIKENLEIMFANDPNVFVAGDLLWYPVEGNNKTRMAPDAMVAFGRPKGFRGSYMMWKEDNISPQVVFEILSPGNTPSEMRRKFEFYDTYGVEEYYVFDPEKIILKGWIRLGSELAPIEEMDGWVSPRLKIRFEIKKDDLHIVRPDGREFLSPLEINQNYEIERKKVEIERHRVIEEQKRAEEERQRAEAERQRADVERMKAERLADKLRSLGIDPASL